MMNGNRNDSHYRWPWLAGAEILGDRNTDATAKTVETVTPDEQWRRAVVEQAEGQCEYVDRGNRCEGKQGLKAWAPKPTRNAQHGTALCPSHYDIVDQGKE